MMFKFVSCITICALWSIVTTTAIAVKECPNIPVAKNFNVNLLCTHHWHHQYYESTDEFYRYNGTKCGISNFGFNDDHTTPLYMDQYVFSTETGEPYIAVYSIEQASDSKQLILRSENHNLPWGPVKGTVIITDNKSYFVITFCTHANKRHTPRRYFSVRIYTTCVTMPPIDLTKIEAKLRKYGEDVELVRADTKGCGKA